MTTIATTITTRITRQQAAALLLMTAEDRLGLANCALRVNDKGKARWEATNGNALLLLTWGIGDGEPHNLEPGVYILDRKHLTRAARMPVKLWDDAVDGIVPLRRDADKRGEWPDTPAVIPGERGETHGEPAAVHGMRVAAVDLPGRVARALWGPRAMLRTYWKITHGRALDVQHWTATRNGVTIDLYLMPSRID